MKKAMILVEDYWHHKTDIEPAVRLIFDNEEEYIITCDPKSFYDEEYSLLISFKDPIENDQIPTPVWCDEKWTDLLFKRISEGMGFIAAHAAVTDLPEDHRIVTGLYNAVFLSHPAPCPLTLCPIKDHPVTKGISEFTYPKPDEHYQMSVENGAEILALTVSQNGRQPALWVKQYGKGRVCMFTSAHNAENLACAQNTALMKNMIDWCRG